MGSYFDEYKNKLISPEQAAGMVKSGDIVSYGMAILFPQTFDIALGARAKDENLHDVSIWSGISVKAPSVVIEDPEGKTFSYMSNLYSAVDRTLIKKGYKNIAYVPTQNHEWYRLRSQLFQPFFKMNVVVMTTTEIDKHGYFNFGMAPNDHLAQIQNADLVIVEINKDLAYVPGGRYECVHIRDVDYIIESTEGPIYFPASAAPTEIEKKVAANILPFFKDRCCFQLGIGGIPGMIGTELLDLGLKDLGIHTEIFSQEMAELCERGIVTGRYKHRDPGRCAYSLTMGGKAMYDFVDHNPMMAGYDCDYSNSPRNIADEDNFISVNQLLEVDLQVQISSETDGFKQISGGGGQLDFHTGAFESNGGAGILATTSTYTDKEGVMHSRIRPTLKTGSVVTVPRQCVNYIATEYGIVNMKGRSVWGRAEKLIELAHPDFREELLQEANNFGLWTKTNKIPW